MLELLGFIPLVIIAFHHFTYLIILSSTRRFEKPLWRVLRPDEEPEDGLKAKDPGAKKTVISHVNCGGRETYKSQYISTTASYDVAHKYKAKKDDLRIAEIDLYALPKSCKLKIWDLTIEKNRDKWLKDSQRLKYYANASREVLLKCNVPIPCRVVDPLGILWRILWPDEDPEVGLTAKNPKASETVFSHVQQECQTEYKSQYISTTASYDVAHKYKVKKDGPRIAEIDLYTLPKSCKLKIWDLTIEKNRDKWLKDSQRLKYYANASREVLLKCNVPIPCRVVDPLGILWRILWPDEDPEVGLTAKNPKASETVSSHVQHECQKEYRSQYISTTASYAVVVRDYERKRMKKGAKKENEGLTRLRIAKIDLNALRMPYKLKLVDLRTKKNREKYLNGADEWKNIARASCMVLLKCNVPIPCHVIDPPE